MNIRITLAQINCAVGDFAGNSAKIIAVARYAAEQKADLLLTPELALSGYCPQDLIFQADFHQRSDAALHALAKALAQWPDLMVIVGHILWRDLEQSVYNAASVLKNGQIIATYLKQCLPNYGVFDEKRYFVAGTTPLVIELKQHKFGIIICEDIWHAKIAKQNKEAGADTLLILNASPYHMAEANHCAKTELRRITVHARYQETGLAMVYVNLVGAQDELVFDGDSFVVNHRGEEVLRLSQFKEQNATIEWGAEQEALKPALSIPESQVYQALMLGLRDYVVKNHFSHVILGLSGGVDSALVLALAVDALGKDQVSVAIMPSRYTSQETNQDAHTLAQRLDVTTYQLPIDSLFQQFQLSLAQAFAGLPEDHTEQNLQARIRAILLMALANKQQALLLCTSNKSEIAVGYSTLYGDMSGALAVIKDLSKTWVYRLCAYRQTSLDFAQLSIFPLGILSRAPSAELKANQIDQDDLPPYEILDGILQLVLENQSDQAIIAAGYAPHHLQQIKQLIHKNEYKRHQAPPGIRVTTRAFGRDWRYPITYS